MAAKHKWSQEVTEHSDALDLDEGVFKLDDPAKIAASLKRSAEHSKRRKGTALQSAMGMLTFYINRAGGIISAPSSAKCWNGRRTNCALYLTTTRIATPRIERALFG